MDLELRDHLVLLYVVLPRGLGGLI